MPVQHQSALIPTPAVTRVDGPVTFSVDVAIVDGDDIQQLDLEFLILDQQSAVHFASGFKSERRQVPVTTSQMTLVHPTALQCGAGHQNVMGAQIQLRISSNGIVQAPPIECGVGISAYTCAPVDAPFKDGPELAAALNAAALAGAASAAAADASGRRSKSEGGAKRGGTRKGKSTGTTKSGGKK